ncbi:MAG: serine/threonine protein kinase [Myxococcales bacterium]|nr:serine/threonine protein kinase [Myxococcales bacterium]
MDERIGSIVGAGWRIDAVLGRGSMATVYAATDPGGAPVALKVLRRALTGDAGMCERFVREAYLTNAVKHPGIVRVFGDGLTLDACPFLVLERLYGQTLEELHAARGGRLPVGEALAVGERIAEILAHVHDAGVVHRDLKPTNVFVTDRGELKILDFGIARSLGEGRAAKGSMVGNVLGSPSFMSPEQALGVRDAVDHQSDLWALGAILFYLLTGEPVHGGPTLEARLLAAASKPARPVLSVMPALHPAVAAVVDRSLSAKKAARYASARELGAALASAASALGSSAPVPAHPAPVASAPPPALPAVAAPPAPASRVTFGVHDELDDDRVSSSPPPPRVGSLDVATPLSIVVAPPPGVDAVAPRRGVARPLAAAALVAVLGVAFGLGALSHRGAASVPPAPPPTPSAPPDVTSLGADAGAAPEGPTSAEKPR